MSPLLSPQPAQASHSRTASEHELASLDMNSLLLSAHTSTSTSSGTGASRIDDDDLLDSLPPLGQSVVEEAEGAYLGLALSALAFAATPASSPSPSGSRGASPSASTSSRSPSARRRISPDYSDPSYFALSRRNLYASPDEPFSSAASSVYSVSSTPSLCDSAASSYTADSLVNTPEQSPAVEPEAYFASSCFPHESTSATISSKSSFSAAVPTAEAKSSIASRRPRASPTLLKLDLPGPAPPLRSTKSFSFAPRSPSFSSASAPGFSSTASSPSPVRRQRTKPRWMVEMEEVAGVSSLVAAAAVETLNLSSSRSRERRCSGGSRDGSPPMLKQRKGSYGYAF
ncbi:hypothetical protein JCM11251_004382 [Rhodosporidiobolus azoricus]